MDPWLQDQQRHKRTWEDMSHHASLSPSPFFFGHPMPSIPRDTPPTTFERRRTSHPYNLASQPSYHSQDNMPDPRVLPRPSLEHRASQTIIDLTDDAGEPDSREMNARYLSRPPQLGRSDALVWEDIIDLTDDVVDDEVEIIDARRVPDAQQAPPPAHVRNRQLPHPHPRPRLLFRHHDAGSVFIPEQMPDPRPTHHGRREQAPRDMLRNFPIAHFQELAGQVGGNVNLANLLPPVVQGFFLGNGNQQMPDHLDYAAHAFARPRQQSKPEHQLPPPAKAGFTRSPKEDDVAICPGCMKELVAEDGNEEQVATKKPNGKAPNQKDREEHHFWVLKECGHVYCNKCYKGRKPDKKERASSNFRKGIGPTGRTINVCAVEGCHTDVGDKRLWVGVFI